MARVERTTTEDMCVLANGLPAFSTSARHFLRDRPREARLAVAAALEAAAAQCDPEAGPEEASQPLAPFVVRRHGTSDMLGVTAAAARLGVSRTTVYDWVGKGTLLGWKSTRRGLTIPASQILGSRKVVAGLADVLDAIGDPELAWAFLTQEWSFEDEVAVPLDMLKVGRTAAVFGAAPGFGATFS